MIELFKLFHLPYTQKVRKIIKILEVLEAEYAELSAYGNGRAERLSCDAFYIEGLYKHIAELYPDDSGITDTVRMYMNSKNSVIKNTDCRTVCNLLRHALYRHSGVQPSEWDLIAPGRRYGTAMQEHTDESESIVSSVSVPVRPFYQKVYVYAEDIRAPFNLGSIFRTAEAFGVERLFLSQGCVSPEQSRARRSSMGCTRFLPWEYRSLDSLPALLPVFALETGGIPITSFTFPQQGVVLLGSEELGLSAEAVKKATAGIVSIPMKGVKASLNVAVAFGIVMQYWTAGLAGSKD